MLSSNIGIYPSGFLVGICRVCLDGITPIGNFTVLDAERVVERGGRATMYARPEHQYEPARATIEYVSIADTYKRKVTASIVAGKHPV